MNRLWQTFHLGLKSLLLHKLRSALTILGIVFGVCSVIAMLAIGEGASYEAQQQIAQLGANNVIVRSVKPPETSSSQTSSRSFFTFYGLTRDEFDRIVATIPEVERALPIRETRNEARYHDQWLEARIVGCTPEYLEVNHLQLAQGRFLTEEDLDAEAMVCVLGHETAHTLFPFENPLGRYIQVNEPSVGRPLYFMVVGETQDRMPSAAVGGSLAAQDFNRDVYLPITTQRERLGDVNLSRRSGSFGGEGVQLTQITVTVSDVSQVVPTADAIEALLRHQDPERQDFEITVPLELLEQAEQMKLIFSVVLGSIAAISLLVGGIGIMNIMLATVTERTREIGVRRALGAKRRDIIEQFLIETTVLSATGGLLGMALGLMTPVIFSGLRWIIEQINPEILESLGTLQNFEPIIVWWSPALAFVISVSIGVIFGLYPARRAAHMDPIEALRHE